MVGSQRPLVGNDVLVGTQSVGISNVVCFLLLLFFDPVTQFRVGNDIIHSLLPITHLD